MRKCFAAIGIWVSASLGVAATTATPAIKLSPATVQVRAGAKPNTQTFTASETGLSHPSTAFSWSLSGPTGATGSISSTGVYTPPVVPPTPNTVTVTVTDSANKLTATAIITVLDPAPVISSLSPSSINTGLAYTVDVIGSGFMPTDQVMLGTTAATTHKFVSSTDIQITGTSTAAAGTKISITVADPNAIASVKTSNAGTLSVVAPVAVTVSPNGRVIRCGTPLALSWHVANNSNQSVTWQVNGIAGGNGTVGTVVSTTAASGTTVTYTAPADLPPAPTPAATPSGTAPPSTVWVTVTATSAADPTASAGLTVYLQNPSPVISSVNPNPINPGPATLTVNGSGFAQGAVVYFAGGALPTTWVSDKQLKATGTVGIPIGRLAAVKVTNPNPGGATSIPTVVPVQLATV